MTHTAADAIRNARMHRRLSQNALARAAGVSKRAVQKWEEGTRTPGSDSLCKLAGALLVEFVCGNDGVWWREEG